MIKIIIELEANTVADMATVFGKATKVTGKHLITFGDFCTSEVIADKGKYFIECRGMVPSAIHDAVGQFIKANTHTKSKKK